MSFKISKNSLENITLNDLKKGLDPVKDKNKIARIEQIFNLYNTNKVGDSVQSLDLGEQVSIMSAMHKADGDNDNSISRKNLRNAGLNGDYKAYRDFMEAYNNAVDSAGKADSQVYNLDFNDDKQTISAKAQYSNDTSIKIDYNQGKQGVLATGFEIKQGNSSERFDINNNLVLKTYDDGSKLKYENYSNGIPGQITQSLGSNETYTYQLQLDGTYFDSTQNSYARLTKENDIEKFVQDNKNRTTSEVFGDNKLDYTYAETESTPATITVTDNQNQQKVYNHEKDLTYSSQNGENKEYFSFSRSSRSFKPTSAPKQDRVPTGKKIRMYAGWRNRQKLDDATKEKFDSMSTASEVLEDLINKPEYMSSGKPIAFDKGKLLEGLIYNNPSMFDKEGNIYSNADWSKLDFPNDLRAYVKTDVES